MPVLAPPPLLAPFLAPLALSVASCLVFVSLALACWYAIPRGLCVRRPVSGCPSRARRVPVVCVCARAPTLCALPTRVGVTRASHAFPMQGAARAA